MKLRSVIIMLSVSLVLTVSVWARSGTFKKAYVGCVSENTLDEFIGAAIDKDFPQMQALIDAVQCFNLEGREYSTIDIGLMTSKVRVYIGSDSIPLYVTTEAVRN